MPVSSSLDYSDPTGYFCYVLEVAHDAARVPIGCLQRGDGPSPPRQQAQPEPKRSEVGRAKD